VIAPDAERFDRLAPTYDQAVPFFAETGRSLVEWVGIAPGLRVLDLGSGRGAVSIALAEAVGMDVEIVAGDVSEQMLSRLHALRLPRVDVKYIDATAIDEPDGSFDLVFCAFLLHFLAGRAQALAEVARVLRASGALAMSVPGPGMREGWWAQYNSIVDEFRSRANLPVPPVVTGGSWDELAAAAGLRVVQRETLPVALRLTGPGQHWEWLLAHSHRGLYDALDEAARDNFRETVLRSLQEDHPSAGAHLLADADFYRMAKDPT
jgi:ubiquinone/menaquinone biosynthesis C-methylase UbiE